MKDINKAWGFGEGRGGAPGNDNSVREKKFKLHIHRRISTLIYGISTINSK